MNVIGYKFLCNKIRSLNQHRIFNNNLCDLLIALFIGRERNPHIFLRRHQLSRINK